MAKGIIRKVKKARSRASAEISAYAKRGGVAAGLASEGYAGGYRDALDAVLLALNGVTPNHRYWWNDEEEQ